MPDDSMGRTPNPGSKQAIALGCTCPVIDNGHGRGYLGQPDVFVVTEGCPLHGTDLARFRRAVDNAWKETDDASR